MKKLSESWDELLEKVGPADVLMLIKWPFWWSVLTCGYQYRGLAMNGDYASDEPTSALNLSMLRWLNVARAAYTRSSLPMDRPPAAKSRHLLLADVTPNIW